jgi:hypothetical protein
MNEIVEIEKGEYAPYYEGYVQLVMGLPLMKVLEKQVSGMKDVFEKLGEKSQESYAPGKWTAKEVLGHIIDTDRIMAMRALCFARGEQNSLPGFDQDAYITMASFNEVPLDLLLKDYELNRHALLSFIRTLPVEAWQRVGVANHFEFSVRALLAIIAGHSAHHLNILKERYLSHS